MPLCACNRVFLQLEEIVPTSKSTGEIIVLGGSGACPPEDSLGTYGWLEDVKTLRSGQRSQKTVNLLRAINNAENYRKSASERGLVGFDPDYFSVIEATTMVKDALSLPGSLRIAPKMFVGPNASFQDFDPKTKKERKMKTELGGGVTLEESTTGKRDGVSHSSCSNCGTPHGLFL